MKRVRLVIADDHPLFRQGLRRVIEDDPQLEVVAEAGDGAAAIQQIESTRPDVAVLDVDMPNGDGFDVARAILGKGLEVGVIFLTMHKDARLLNTALDLGARGYLLKDSAVTEIVSGVRAVAAGREYVSPELTGMLLQRGRRAADLAAAIPGLARLTPTERRVLKLVAEYRTSREIAAELFISPRTVEHHRSSICEKLELRGAHALVRFATENKSEL